jgi:hypothetical protein
MPQSADETPIPASGAVLTIGIAALLIGTLIATLSGPAGRTPGIVIVTIGLVLTVPSFVMFRRARRRAFYRVTKPWSWTTLLDILGTLVAVVGGSFLIVILLDKTMGVRVPAAVLFIPGIGFAVKRYLGLRTAVVVNAAGVVVDRVGTPWSAVDHLLVADDHVGVRVGVRRRQDSAAGESTPAPHVLVPRAKLDLADLRHAVRRFGPPGVRLVEGPDSTQRTSGQAGGTGRG